MKKTARNYSGQQKDAIRRLSVSPGRIYKSILDLPGEHCRSTFGFVSNGNCTEDTTVTIVERHKPTMAVIRRKIERLPFKNVNFAKPDKVENTLDYGPYDLINLDTCSSLNYALLKWISNQRFLPNGEINLWLTSYRNNQSFRDSLMTSFSETKKGSSVCSELRSRTDDNMEKVGPIQRVTAAAIYSALNNYDCKIDPIQSYCEHVNFMYFYRFTGLTRRKTPRASLDEILIQSDIPKNTWNSDKGESAGLADENLVNMCVKAVLNGPGAKAYTTRQLRLAILDGELAGKNPKWIKAGWKSCLSRYRPDMKSVTHNYIDSV